MNQCSRDAFTFGNKPAIWTNEDSLRHPFAFIWLEPLFSLGAQLFHELGQAIQKLLPHYPLVLHGSSSVPQEEVLRINAAGGTLDPTARGVDENELLRAASLGVTKINIDTDGRLVWTRVHREFFRDNPKEFDFRPVGKKFVAEYAQFLVGRSQKLGSAGKLAGVRAALYR